jgi:hypothetical protein
MNNLIPFTLLFIMSMARQLHRSGEFVSSWQFHVYMWFIGPMLLVPYMAFFFVNMKTWKERGEAILSGAMGYFLAYFMFS